MEHIQRANEGNLAIVTMARGKANALNMAMAEELLGAMQAAMADDNVRAIVLASDRPKFFSAGFDIAEVFRYEYDDLAKCFQAFGGIYEEMLFGGKPVIAAMPGHAYAGGAVLALAADMRVMAEGNFGFALNEINIGATLPPTVFRMLEGAVGGHAARRIILTGDPVMTADALKIGLVDEVVPVESVLARAKELATMFASKPGTVFAEMKQIILSSRGYSRSTVPGPAPAPWFTPETMARKNAMLEALSKPKS